MDKNESPPGAFEPEFARPGRIPVAIAEHNPQRHPKLFDSRQRGRITNVAQMPDLIGAPQAPRQSGGAAIVRVCKNGNPHPARKPQCRPFGKDGLHAGLTPASSFVVLGSIRPMNPAPARTR
jgi:hypothetical protein